MSGRLPRRARACRSTIPLALPVVAVMALAGFMAVPPAPDVVPGPAVVAAGRGVTGRDFVYTVAAGDTLTRIGAQLGVEPRELARQNGLPRTARLRIGQGLRVDNQHVIPGGISDGLVLNIPQRMVFLLRDGRLERAYPAAVGRSASKWQTPIRAFRISAKDVDPTWVVPAAIQKEMEEAGKPVETMVPPGPDNPLGAYRLRLAGVDWAIHGTNAPASIYTFQTHGCVRLEPADIEDLFARVQVGDPVTFLYAPVLLAVGPDGAILLEAQPDVYNRKIDFAAIVDQAAQVLGVTSRLDPARVRQVLAERAGIARRVDRQEDSPERE